MNSAQATPRVVTLGETMALMLATEYGALQHRPAMALGVGGSESNVAIGLQRLGIDATWIGRVGADSLGDLVLREIRAEGVQVVSIPDAEAATSVMVKERRAPADTRVWYYRAGLAGSRLTLDDFSPELVTSASLLHVTGISLALSPTMSDTVFGAVELARSAGVPVSFDLNFRGKLWSREAAAESYARMLPLADLVFAGDDEAAILVRDGEPLELAHRLIGAGAGQAIVKLGSRGAVAVVDGHEYQRTAVPITPVDTVGAGDAFVAGYLAEYLLGKPVSERLDTAVTAGALACLVAGDWEGLPTRADLASLGTGASEPVSR
ncbi:sugar kinase [Salinibacterium sp. ZJ454]|uniref:sugar kinase n=1 Tax=Salinibacterium sp. ZJ454 TaxID=2708339 RepID=UPI0014209B65|nr:sugar kinase [Salinibacterium sp. ZJ454]